MQCTNPTILNIPSIRLDAKINKKTHEIKKELHQDKIENPMPIEFIYEPTVEIDHDQYLQKNPDYIGWLHIPNSKISYPILFPENNDIYLHRDFNKNKSYAGSLFIDSYTPKDNTVENIIIHGHNMRNKTMFGSIKNWISPDFFKTHNIIEFHTPEHIYIFEIFAIRKVQNNINSINYKFNNIDINDFTNEVKSTAEFYTNKKIEKPIITLSTCMGDDSMRMILNGTLVKIIDN